MTSIVEKIATARLVEILFPGVQGPAGTIEIGTVESVAPNVPAEVTNTGTKSKATLNFKIPQSDATPELRGLVSDAKNSAIDAKNSAVDSDASRVAAFNNASLAAEKATAAAASATAAGTSATASSTSALAAQQSADDAVDAKTSAISSANAASASALTASQKATAAQTSADSAFSFMVSAESAKTSANASAVAASNSANVTSGYASDAYKSKQDAADSALAAQNSATTAANMASDAAASSTSASNSASFANTSSLNAQTAASTASSEANKAATSASSAATSATNAAASASFASARADIADAKASLAQNYANAAQASNSDATIKANDAHLSAISAATSSGSAANSATNAATSATNAASSATLAGQKATEAAASETASAFSAATAQSSAATAQNSAALAVNSAAEASGSATNSATSANLSQEWATKTSAEVVPGQGYGSKKYAQDAATSAQAAAASAQSAADMAANIGSATGATAIGVVPVGGAAYLDMSEPYDLSGSFRLPGDGSTWLSAGAVEIKITNDNASLIDLAALPNSMKSSLELKTTFAFWPADSTVTALMGQQSYASNVNGGFASTTIALSNRKFATLTPANSNGWITRDFVSNLPAPAEGDVFCGLAYEGLTANRGVAITQQGKIYGGTANDWGPIYNTTYTLLHTMATQSARNVLCGRGKWIVYGFGEAVVSADGINWTASPTAVNQISEVYYDNANSRFILVGQTQNVGTGPTIQYSTDGLSWTTAYSQPQYEGVRWVAKVNGVFVFALTDGKYLHSTTGIDNFTLVTPTFTGYINKIYYDPDSARYVTYYYDYMTGGSTIKSFASIMLTDPKDHYPPMNGDGVQFVESFNYSTPGHAFRAFAGKGDMFSLWGAGLTRTGVTSFASTDPLGITPGFSIANAPAIGTMQLMRRVK